MIRALIVDDNASMRAMLNSLLGSRGYEVVAALEDGSQIMEVIREKSPQVICLDYQMPGRDGLDILREINETNPLIDVLFMTASEDASIEQKAADAGAAGFLRKPFGQSQVLEELEQVRLMREQATLANERLVAPAPAAGSTQKSATPRPGAPRSKVPSVVIADDNGSIRYLLKGILSDLGLDVLRSVANGQEAINAVRDLQPQVLCLDVEMPVMGGLEALPLIRQVSPQTKVVMVTANAARGFVQQAAELGARGYIVKPIRPAYIEAFMKKLLA